MNRRAILQSILAFFGLVCWPWRKTRADQQRTKGPMSAPPALAGGISLVRCFFSVNGVDLPSWDILELGINHCFGFTIPVDEKIGSQLLATMDRPTDRVAEFSLVHHIVTINPRPGEAKEYRWLECNDPHIQVTRGDLLWVELPEGEQ